MRLWLTFYFFFLISTAAIAIPGPGGTVRPNFQDGSRVRVLIKQRVQIKKDVVTLGDVADISTLTEKEKKELQGIIITTFTGGKSKARIPSNYIRSRIEEVTKVPISNQVKASEYVEIELIKESVQSYLIRKIKYLIKSKSAVPENIEVQITEIGKGASKINVEDFAQGAILPVHRKTFWRGRTFFSFEKASSEKVLFSAKIQWFAKRWVAKRTIERGRVLKADYFKHKRVEVQKNRDDSIKSEDSEMLAKLIRNSFSRNVIPMNGVFRKSHIANSPDLTAGSIVKVQIINDGGLRLTISGKLLRSSRIGDQAHVKVLKTGKTVNGVLLRGNLVVIRE